MQSPSEIAEEISVSRAIGTLDLLAPKTIQPQEEGRVNPAYTRLEDFNPESLDTTVTYIWVLNHEEDIILGINDLKKFQRAFAYHQNDPLAWGTLCSDIGDEDAQLGHVTLSMGFFANGEANNGIAAYLGGEIKFDQTDGCWLISNRSGRFGRNKCVDSIVQQQTLNTLEMVAERFSDHMNIEFDVRCGFKAPCEEIKHDLRINVGKV